MIEFIESAEIRSCNICKKVKSTTIDIELSNDMSKNTQIIAICNDCFKELKNKVEDIEICNVCGETSINTVLVECETCNELVCEDNNACSEILNWDQITCKTCTDKWTKYDCTKCIVEDCHAGREFTTYYDCPDYVDAETAKEYSLDSEVE